MGALHDGHLSLVARAREQCALVVLSVFVNPSQFDDPGDLRRYPRDEERDRELAARAGVDILFAPPVDEVYPERFATEVEVRGLGERLEGECRGRAHFRGVATVVCKLLHTVAPDRAYFGQKDAQQVAVIRRMVADLDMAVAIESCATVRERDGLAMSSRNALLSGEERSRAAGLYAGLSAGGALAARGERDTRALLAGVRRAIEPFAIALEYVALVDPDSFEEVHSLERDSLLVMAARVGEVRLIDNLMLSPASADESTVNPQREEALTACSV